MPLEELHLLTELLFLADSEVRDTLGRDGMPLSNRNRHYRLGHGVKKTCH